MRRAGALGLVLCGAGLAWLLTRSPGEGPEPRSDDGASLEEEGGWVPGLSGSFARRRPTAPGGRPKANGIGAIGYAPGSEPPPARTGLQRSEPGALPPGLVLLCHGDAAAAELMDLDGNLAHRWALDYASLPDAPPLEGEHQIPWRAVALLPGGDLLAIHSGRGMVRVGRDSKLRWARFDRFHHDVVPEDERYGLALARTERVVEEVQPDGPIVDDLLVRFELETGEIVASLSLWEAFAASEYADLLDQLTVREGDVMHANGLALLDAEFCGALRVDGVGPDDVLVSMRDLDLVAAVDLEAGRIDWLTAGPKRSRWRGLHDPEPWVDDRGTARMLVFDNLGGPGGTSRLVDLRLPEASIAWSYEGSPPASFDSLFCGTVERLPGGAVLAAESLAGRVLVIEPRERRVLWEWASPRLAGPRDEFVAAVFSARWVDGRPDWLQ